MRDPRVSQPLYVLSGQVGLDLVEERVVVLPIGQLCKQVAEVVGAHDVVNGAEVVCPIAVGQVADLPDHRLRLLGAEAHPVRV